MATDFENTVLDKLDEITDKLSELDERLEQLEEAIRNVSTPGRDYDIFEVE